MEKKPVNYWGDRLPKTAPGTDTLTIETEQVERGQVFLVSHASIADETTANKSLELGIKRGSEYCPVLKRKAATNDYDVGLEGQTLVLVEGEQLYGKVYAPTAGDKCWLVFGGELVPRE